MAVLVTSMMLCLVAAAFQQAAALSVVSSHTSTFFDPAKNWMGETTLHELFDEDTIDQLEWNGFIKTRQNPDYPDRTQYFVVKSPADAKLIYTECLQNTDGEDVKVQNQGEETVQNLLEKRQRSDVPDQTHPGKEWISTQNLLEAYGFDKVEELLKSDRVEKRQNPRCPERTQYFVKEESPSSAKTEEEDVQEPEESKGKSLAEAKLQKHGKATNRDVLRKHGDQDATVQDHEEARAQKQDEPKVHKQGKKHNHKGKLYRHYDQVVDVQKHEDDAVQEYVNKEDADGVADSDDKQKSAAIPAGVLTADEEDDQEPEESKVKRHAEAKVTAQKQGEPKVNNHKKKHNHKGKLHQHDDKVVDVQKHGNNVDQKHNNKEDVDGVVGDGKEKSAAIPPRLLTTVVTVAASVFFV